MLTKTQIDEIRQHLEKAQNPLFFYDNDLDGLCSFILLRRYIGRGKGVAVKSYPDLNAQYAQRAKFLNADYVFVLDKPLISNEFVKAIEEMQVPLVWIDHHDIDNALDLKEDANVHIYNTSKNKGKDKSTEPVTFLCYSVTQKKEDLWIALIGCIADNFLPPFAKEFAENYPDFWGKAKTPFDIYYNTEIGRIAQSISFGLKDSITHVVALQNFIIACKSPADVFQETEVNSAFRKKVQEIRNKYSVLLEQAESEREEKMIFFEYSGDLSISAELSNELWHKYPDRMIIVAYKKGLKANVSLRGKNIKNLLESIIGKFPDATGGGHTDAVGARLNASDLSSFKQEIQNSIK